MTFVPTPPEDIPTPDEIMARLTRGVGDPATGYITPEDLAFAWQAFLSSIIDLQAAAPALLDARVAAVESAAATLDGEVDTLTATEAGHVAALTATLAGLQAAVDGLTATDATTAAALAALQAAVDVLVAADATTAATIAALDARVTGVEGEVLTIGTTTLPALDGRITAVEGAVPDHAVVGYVETAATTSTTSSTLVDVPGMSVSVTTAQPSRLIVVASTAVRLVSGTNATAIGVAVNIDGTDHDETANEMFQDSDRHAIPLVHATDAPVPAGTYTVKLRYRRVSGSSTPGISRADMLVLALPVDPTP